MISLGLDAQKMNASSNSQSVQDTVQWLHNFANARYVAPELTYLDEYRAFGRKILALQLPEFTLILMYIV